MTFLCDVEAEYQADWNSIKILRPVRAIHPDPEFRLSGRMSVTGPGRVRVIRPGTHRTARLLKEFKAAGKGKDGA